MALIMSELRARAGAGGLPQRGGVRLKPPKPRGIGHEIDAELLEPALREPEPQTLLRPSELQNLTATTEPQESSEPEVSIDTITNREKKGLCSQRILKKGLSRLRI